MNNKNKDLESKVEGSLSDPWSSVSGVIVLDQNGNGCCGIRVGDWILTPSWALSTGGPYTVFIPELKTANLVSYGIIGDGQEPPSPWNIPEQGPLMVLLLYLGTSPFLDTSDVKLPYPQGLDPVTKGQPLIVEYTPFLVLHYFNTWSQGIVSNVLEPFFLLDAPVNLGSEGAPVFLLKGEERICMGMIIRCSGSSHGENLYFSVAVTLSSLMAPFLETAALLQSLSLCKEIRSQPSSFDKAIVLIQCGYRRGTGCVVRKVLRESFILTCAHVVEFGNINDVKIIIHFENQSMEAKLVFSSSKSSLYDIAILSVDYLEKTPFILAKKPPLKGEKVMAIGHCVFNEGNKPCTPTVTSGIVSKIYSPFEPIQTTCTVHSGASGGAIIRLNGELVGVIVFSILDKLTNEVLPRLSFFIPISLVINCLENFIKTRDVKCFCEVEKNHFQNKFLENYFRNNL